MRLNNKIVGWIVSVLTVVVLVFGLGCDGGGGGSSSIPEGYDYTTTTRVVKTQFVDASVGAIPYPYFF